MLNNTRALRQTVRHVVYMQFSDYIDPLRLDHGQAMVKNSFCPNELRKVCGANIGRGS